MGVAQVACLYDHKGGIGRNAPQVFCNHYYLLLRFIVVQFNFNGYWLCRKPPAGSYKPVIIVNADGIAINLTIIVQTDFNASL